MDLIDELRECVEDLVRTIEGTQLYGQMAKLAEELKEERLRGEKHYTEYRIACTKVLVRDKRPTIYRCRSTI